MIQFQTVKPGTILYVFFDSFAGSTGASITMSGFAASDIEIYKDGGTTQRASDNGYTLLDSDGTDFDGLTGIHGFSINLADNSDAGFYAAGSRYYVIVSSVTVDSQVVSFVAARFVIGYPSAVLDTTIASLSSQTSFTLTAGPAENNALNGMWLIVHDVASAVQQAVGIVSAYTGATKTVTLAAAPTFTIAATDNVSVMGPVPLQPTVMGRALDVSTGGEAGLDWNNIGSPTTSQTLSGTTVGTATAVTTVNGLAAGTITATSIASDAITATKIANDAITAAKIATGAITAAKFADNAITASVLDATATEEIADEVWDEVVAGHTGFGTFGQRMQPVWETVATAGGNNTVTLNTAPQADDFFNGQFVFITGGTGAGQVRRIVDWVQSTKVLTVSPNWVVNPAASSDLVILPDRAEADGTGLTAAQVADAVWDEARADHTTSGTFGQGASSVQGNVTGSVGSVATDGISASSIAADAIGASELAATAATEIAAAVWDRARSSHVADGSFGQILQAIRAGTAQAGAGTTITLDASASATDDFYLNGLIQIIGGTGVGQARYITDYVGATKVATVSTAWGTAPDNTSIFVIHPGDAVPGATAPSAADNAAAVWNAARSSFTTSGTFGQGVSSVQGAVTGAVGSVTGNVGGNVVGSVGSVTGNVGGNVVGSVGSVGSNGITATSLDATASAEIADAVWDEPRGDHVSAGSFGQAVQLVRAGTAQAGASTTITLDASASSINDFYNDAIVEIIAGTGVGQARFIADYVGTSKVATVAAAWGTTPDNTSVFIIRGFGAIPGATAPTAAQVADAVWDEARGDHTTSGTFGQGVSSVQGNVTGSASSIAGNVAGNVTGSVGSLAAQAKADVNAEVVDVLTVDTFAELSSIPAAAATFSQMVRWLYILARNTLTQTATTTTIKADNGSTNVATAATTDDGTTFTRGEWS